MERPTSSRASSARCSSFFGCDAGVDEWQLDVLQGAGAWDQVEALEDEPDLAVAHDCELVVVEAADVDPVEEVAAAGRHVEAADDVHQGALAAAGRADDRDEVAALDREGDAAQSVHRRRAERVALRHPLVLR